MKAGLATGSLRQQVANQTDLKKLIARAEASLTSPPDWIVVFESAICRFLATDPDRFTIANVADWIDQMRTHGPAADGVKVWPDDELYVVRFPRTDLICRYFVVDYERLVILDRFEGP